MSQIDITSFDIKSRRDGAYSPALGHDHNTLAPVLAALAPAGVILGVAAAVLAFII